MKVTVFPSINLLAVVVAAIVGFVIGGVWYAPPVSGNAWLKLLGKRREEIGKPGQIAGIFVLTLITAFVLAVFIGYAGAKTALDGAIIGLWTWFGFNLTETAGTVMYEGKPIKLLAINAGLGFVIFLVMGAILGAWP